MRRWRLEPVARTLARCRRVEYAADPFDLLGDLLRIGTALGALEEHVLQEVRHSGDGSRLIARAHGVGNDQRSALDPRHGTSDYADTIGKRRLVIGVRSLVFLNLGFHSNGQPELLHLAAAVLAACRQ